MTPWAHLRALLAPWVLGLRIGRWPHRPGEPTLRQRLENTYPHQVDVQPSEQLVDLLRWCERRFPNGWGIMTDQDGSRFYFDTAEAAALFRATWGGKAIGAHARG